jgi:putative ATP-binding cassette transporter
MFSYLWSVSRWTVFFVLIVGLFSGLCSAALIATVNKALSNRDELETLLRQL